MTRLLQADRARLEEILDGTYAIWGEGLSRSAYSAWNRAQMRTEWGRDHLRRMALIDGETLLASAKRYDFRARIGPDTVSVLGIGAVFTPADRRGHGHARALMELMKQDAAARGCRYALLFSEIGTAYYESMGFRAMPRKLASVALIDRDHLTERAGAPATFVRSGGDADLPAIAEISARYRAGSGFSLDRSAALVAFGFTRRRLLAGLGQAGVRQVEFFVAEEGHRPVAYVFITRGPRGAVLEECGDHDPGGARIGAILQVLAARTPAEPALRMTAWLPPALRPPQVRVDGEFESPDIMMIAPLGEGGSSDASVVPAIYWQTDVF